MDNLPAINVKGTVTGRFSSSQPNHTENPHELPKSCWGLAKLCLSLISQNFRLSVQLEQYRKDAETLARIRQSVGLTREALERMTAAEKELRAGILGASGLEIGKDYNIHWGYRTRDDV